MSYKSIRASLFIFLSVLVGCSTTNFPPNSDRVNSHPSPTITTSPTSDGRLIAFIALTDYLTDNDEYVTGSDVYVIRSDGSNLRNLTNSRQGQESTPAWSSDGNRIAFMRDFDIYWFDLASERSVQLTDDEAWNLSPTWSSDGKQIAFSSRRLEDEEADIYTVNEDGSGLEQLTFDPAADFDPAWSPDSQHIAFVSNRDGNNEIYLIELNGNEPINLTQNAADDANPAWSPDGQRLAFTSNRDEDKQIYVVTLADLNVVKITDYPGSNTHPDWSPDGKKIIFLKLGPPGEASGLAIIDVSSKSLEILTSKNNPDWPVWQP